MSCHLSSPLFQCSFSFPILMSNALVFIHAGFVCVTNFLSLSSLAMACYPLPCFPFHLRSFFFLLLTLAQSFLCHPSFLSHISSSLRLSPSHPSLLLSPTFPFSYFSALVQLPSLDISHLGLSFSLRVQS